MKLTFLSNTTAVLALLLLWPMSLMAQRTTDRLDRGLVAVPASDGAGNLVSWRLLPEEYYDVTYNVYKDGVKVASGLSASNYQDKTGNDKTGYQVSAVVRGVEQEKCETIKRWSGGFLRVPCDSVYDRNGKNVTADYVLNDISLADVDGDGRVEFLVKRNYAGDILTSTSEFHHYECYTMSGQRLWWIDLGPNMISGPDEQYDIVGYDWDQDGKAEALLRGVDNMIIHASDGSTDTIGSIKVDTRSSVSNIANMTYTNTGNEYLLYLNGETGKPYQIGPASHPDYMDYPLERGTAGDWGDTYGHRSTKHYFGAPFLDGRKASIFLGRGCYTQHKMAAYDVDPQTHQLTQRWYWYNNAGWGTPWYAQGYHNFQIADVDEDGRDEIVFGSMVIDDDGLGLSTSGLGHGDAQHCGDFDPYRKGLEQFACNEDQPSCNFRNATTSEIYYRLEGTSDDGRSIAGKFTDDYPGCQLKSWNSGIISACADKVYTGDIAFQTPKVSFRIYWDGDLLDEFLDSPGTEKSPAVWTGTGARIFLGSGTLMNNWSKNNPCASGDIIGDWREEIIAREYTNMAFYIYTSPYPTTYRIPTLWSDTEYRNAMVWQCVGYNQPPHLSYFLGQLEGITTAPPVNTMTGRTEIADGGTITSLDEHLIVCETNNTNIKIQDGAAPYMVTFDIPSWVKGTAASNCTKKDTPIDSLVYTCEVTGGALTGSMRLVKTGDGILHLPKVDMTYTGQTNVWGGTLDFDGTLQKSALWMNRFTTLSSDGGQFLRIKAEYGATLYPGGKGNIGSLSVVDTLSLNFGSRLVLDIDHTNQTADHISCGTLLLHTQSWEYGPKYNRPVIELSGEVGEGTYFLGKVGKLIGELNQIKVEGNNGLKTSLKLNNDSLFLNLATVREATSVVWAGANGDAWDYANTENFYKVGDENLTPYFFVEGDTVLFNDEASVSDVTLSDELTPASVTISNSTKAYTFSGNGTIATGSLTKEGNGSVKIYTANTYTGGNYLKGGTVMVNSLSNSTAAYGSLGGVTASADKFTMENGANLSSSVEITNGSPIKMIGDEGGIITNAGTFTQQATVSGTLLTKKGSGTLIFSSSNNLLNRLCIKGGTVSGCANPAHTLELQSGTAYLNDGSSCTIDVTGTKGVVYFNADRGTFTNKLIGDGTLTAYYVPVNYNKGAAYPSRTSIAGDFSAFEGTLVANATAGGGFVFNNSGMPLATLNIPNDIYVYSMNANYTLGTVTGNGTLSGPGNLGGSSVAYVTWKVGNETDFTFPGKLTWTAGLNKVGTGTMTVSGTWDNTNAVKVTEGSLKVSGSACLGTGALTVGPDGALIGTNTASAGLKNSSITISGTLQPCISKTINYMGNMYFNGKNVTIKEDGTLRFGVFKASTSANVMSGSSIQNIGRLTVNGTIAISLKPGYTPAVGDVIRLWTGVTSFAGSPTIQADGDSIEYDASHIDEGYLVVSKIIDPTAIERVQVSDNADLTTEYYDLMGIKNSTLRRGVNIIRRGNKTQKILMR